VKGFVALGGLKNFFLLSEVSRLGKLPDFEEFFCQIGRDCD